MSRMTTASGTPRYPFWFRHPVALQYGVLVVIAAAAVTGIVVALVQGSILGAVPPLVAVTGVILGRRRPRTGFVLAAAAPLLAIVLDVDPLVTWTLTVFAVFYLTLRGLSARTAGPFAAAANYLAVVLSTGSFIDPEALVAASLALAAAASGSATRGQVRYLRMMEERAAQAIATRDIEVNRSLAEERLRIARDLHDVIGHQVAVLSMNVGVAEMQVGEDTARAEAALRSARSNVQAILQETQRILDVMRLPSEGNDRLPAAEAHRIPELVDSVRAAGSVVVAELPAAFPPMDPAAGAAAYRVVQEALTNAHKYGVGATTVTVRVFQDERILAVQVRNRAKPDVVASDRQGYGLVGMRERVSSAGGTLSIETPADAFVVTARLPLDGRTSR